ncbi:MAG: hypothetical protein JWM59_3283 [Verrucomicrobiales bacterium]|nr:hypothetical protein [Verrucomicrobiales bacterium]
MEGGGVREKLSWRQSPLGEQRINALTAIGNLINGIASGMDGDRLAWVGFWAGYNAAKAGIDDLAPAIRQGTHFMDQQKKGRPSTATAMREAVAEFIRRFPECDAQTLGLMIQEESKKPASTIVFTEGRGRSGAGFFKLGETKWSYATMLKEIRAIISAMR